MELSVLSQASWKGCTAGLVLHNSVRSGEVSNIAGPCDRPKKLWLNTEKSNTCQKNENTPLESLFSWISSLFVIKNTNASLILKSALPLKCCYFENVNFNGPTYYHLSNYNGCNKKLQMKNMSLLKFFNGNTNRVMLFCFESD